MFLSRFIGRFSATKLKDVRQVKEFMSSSEKPIVLLLTHSALNRQPNLVKMIRERHSQEESVWLLGEYEPRPLSEASSVFGLKLLPGAFLIKFQSIIDFLEGDAGSDKIDVFMSSLDKAIGSSSSLQKDKEQREFVSDLLKRFKSGKEIQEAEELLLLGLSKMSSESKYFRLLQLLKCHLSYVKQDIGTFAQLWQLLPKETVVEDGFEEANIMRDHYAKVWLRNEETMLKSAELQSAIDGSNRTDFESMFELAKLVQKLAPRKSIEMLSEIVEKSPNWEEGKAETLAKEIAKRMQLKVSKPVF